MRRWYFFLNLDVFTARAGVTDVASTQDAPVSVYGAPSPHGDLSTTGVRGWAARRPLTTFLVIALGASWLLFVVPVLAYHRVIPGAGLPIEIFALAATLLVLLPAALWVTSVTDGRAGVRALLVRAIRWRFSAGWWLAVILGLPVIALLLGLAFGGSIHAMSVGSILVKQSLSILLAVVVINLWEETVWAGFFQTRQEYRFPFVVAALLTALPFAGVHLPLLLLSDHVTLLSVLKGIVGLVVLGAAVRLLIGVFLRACADSVLAVGVLHQVFDACNNRGGLVDSLLDGADAALMTEIGVVLLTVAAAAVLLWRRGASAFARRRAATAMTSAAN
jgi:membrane protease YdiL (CAAX protease family)